MTTNPRIEAVTALKAPGLRFRIDRMSVPEAARDEFLSTCTETSTSSRRCRASSATSSSRRPRARPSSTSRLSPPGKARPQSWRRSPG